jgi:uncharacterized SAM-dependent methyltransferase
MASNTEDRKMRAKLTETTLDFFLNHHHGILWPYFYGAPQDDQDPVRGGILYNEMLASEPDYYLYKYEAELFQTRGKKLAALIGGGATFIELGPGSTQSLRLKTLPLLKVCEDLQGYVGIDISQSFLDQGLGTIREALPDLPITGIQQDFTQLTELPDCPRPVIFFKGSTITNLTKDEMPMFIRSISELAQDNQYLLLVQDSNQDEASLMSAYDTPKMTMIQENIMYRVARDCDTEGMNPGAFRYAPQWDAPNHDFKHVLVATEAQSFTIQGHTITIKAGDEFHTMSSFKYPVDVFQAAICSTGYRVVDVIKDASGRMAAHVFKR